MSAAPLQAIASGVVTGCVYALVALSLVIIYKSTDLINFAGGELVMIGGYFAMLGLVFFQMPYWAIFAAVAIVVGLIGAAFDRLIVDRVLGRSVPGQSTLVALVITTVGLSYVLKGSVRVVPYTEEVRRLPPLLTGEPVMLGPVILQQQDVAIVVIAVLFMLGWWLFFRYTMLGKALRATSENPRAAALAGIPVRTMRMAIWAIAAGFASLAGILLGPKLLMTPDMGVIVILAFAAAIVGGFQNLLGCIVGGIVLGIVQNLVGLYISSQAIAVTPFVVIMLVLVLRPQGLFGGAVATRKV
jgi:branched-chain amino acid transport system permease protein